MIIKYCTQSQLCWAFNKCRYLQPGSGYPTTWGPFTCALPSTPMMLCNSTSLPYIQGPDPVTPCGPSEPSFSSWHIPWALTSMTARYSSQRSPCRAATQGIPVHLHRLGTSRVFCHSRVGLGHSVLPYQGFSVQLNLASLQVCESLQDKDLEAPGYQCILKHGFAQLISHMEEKRGAQVVEEAHPTLTQQAGSPGPGPHWGHALHTLSSMR